MCSCRFKFWVAATRAVLLCIFLTCFEAFDLPVFWPILVGYFLVLFATTMKDRVKHMIEYRYVPFSTGKKKYEPKEEGAKKSSGPLRLVLGII